ncbi:YhcN/YlaJ family sporulation lipoprotein [Paenibacillus xylaniclasticus]|uniref:YhcN/YlaJ family sporulation lipoprotein n=1 Tax=Paenibacillus xylaniclasticus TaxID=588083 RepID=UPI000FDC4634|nr:MULTISPECIES: YhcN/YlaJ family sporulation lipoprotein [Paenibacillus]GFN30080.1 lipoprotein YhcN [Paenibacillus curdlanolyticus]
MHRKFKVIAASAMLGAILAGCAANQGDLGNRAPVRSNSVRYDMNGNQIMNKRFANDQMNEMNRVNGRRLNSNNLIGSHENYRLEMSKNIADRITTKVKEVKTANVMLTNSNAYVAVSLRDGASAGGSSPVTPLNTGGMTPSPRYGTYSTAPHNNNMYNRTNNMYGDGTYRARAGADANADIQLTEHVKSQIAAEVRKLAPSVAHVYISANPDFVDRMSGYWKEVQAGHPIQGFIAEFNAMVERLFPARADVNL